MTARRRGWPEEDKLKAERGPGPLEFDEMPPAWLDEIGELFHRYCDEIDASIACRIAILAHEIGYTIGTFRGKEFSAKDRADLLRSVLGSPESQSLTRWNANRWWSRPSPGG